MPFVLGPCGVSVKEVSQFVSENVCVKNWLRRYRSASRSGEWLSGGRLSKARMLCRFFKWLRTEKGVKLSPSELLDYHLELRQSSKVRDRQWLLNLVLEHSRDNPDFQGYSDARKYDIFSTVKVFCDSHEAPLTSARGVYGKKRRKKRRRQINISEAKKILGGLSQRDRTICFLQLQSGMEIDAVLNKFSYMWHSQVKPQLDRGCERLKIWFDERKGNGVPYFTYVSRDGIHELKKWLAERKRIIEGLQAKDREIAESVLDGEPIFISYSGTPLRKELFLESFSRKMRGKATSHMFRKLFKSEASVPDRAVDRSIIEFFMGHINGIDAVGGEYDRTPEIHEDVIEREYVKLEPYINIYSGATFIQEHEQAEEIEDLRRQLAVANRKIERIENYMSFAKEQLEKQRKEVKKKMELPEGTSESDVKRIVEHLKREGKI